MPNYVSNKTIEKLKHELVRNNFISYDNLSEAEETAKKKNLNLARTLVEERFITEETLLKFIQDNLHIPYVNLEDYSLEEKCLSSISAEDAKKYKILPLFRIENVLTVAMADPLDLFVINNLVKFIKCDIEPIICSEELILESIEKYYSPKGLREKNLITEKGLKIDWREELNEEAPDISHAKKIVNSIVSQALLEEAFEIIFENIEEGLNVKFKKTRTIEDKGVIPFLLSSLCVSHIKTLCSLDDSVSGIPQLGKFSCSADITYVTGVVSTFPSTKGERIVIKLYKPPKTIKELPIKETDRDIILKSLEKPGIVLIVGSELSGKTFLAYSFLNSLDSVNKNIMTVESIVKYDLANINQCELNEKIGFSIEKALKFIDFQSPDILYIEEILSGSLLDNILTLVKSGKTIITEVNADNADDLSGMFSTDELKNLEKSLNCVVTVSNLINVTVQVVITHS